MDNLLSVKNLSTHFYTDRGTVKAVNNLSFDLKKGETLGIVGESGSGKTVANLSILRLISSPPGKIVEGEIYFLGENLLSLDEEDLRKIRGNKISIVFQDPMTSLNPFLKVGKQISEVIEFHFKFSKKDARNKTIEIMKAVGIPSPDKRINDYPHQFSGGMRQRVMIATAISCNPELLIADEPTTALDVTIQAQILELLKKLKKEIEISIILVTHDLGIVAGMCDRIIIMYAGSIVEEAPVKELFSNPSHPYTSGLLKSVPRMDEKKEKLSQIPGSPPDLIDLPRGCPFYPRCERRITSCKQEKPFLREIKNGHKVACYLSK